MGRRPQATNYVWRILAKIMQEKVITETELLKMIISAKPMIILNQSYKQYVDAGIPIRRKVIEAKWNRTGAGSRHIDHRNVIYYVQ